MAFDSFYFEDDIVQDSTSLMAKSPRSLFAEYKQLTQLPPSSSTGGREGVGGGREGGGGGDSSQIGAFTTSAQSNPPLPSTSAESKMYLSSALMLKKTRAEVAGYAKDLGAVATIADLPVSSDVRRTVAKMFAEPKNAEAISDAEWRRRELEYRMNRELFNEKIEENLRRERDVMQRELAQLPRQQQQQPAAQQQSDK